MERYHARALFRMFLKIRCFRVGVNVDEILKPDPLLVHYQEEIERLQNANAALQDKVRDLEETLAERDCCDDPDATIHFFREKMRYLREGFALEKKEYYCSLVFPPRKPRPCLILSLIRQRIID